MQNVTGTALQKADAVGLQRAAQPPTQQQLPCWQAQSHLHRQSGPPVAEASKGFMNSCDGHKSTPMLNAAAKTLLMDCLHKLDGISPAARMTLQQLVSNMITCDSPAEPAATATAGQPSGLGVHVLVNGEGSTLSLHAENAQQAVAAAAAAAGAQQPAIQKRQQEGTAPVLHNAPTSVLDTPVLSQLQVQPSVGEQTLPAAPAAIRLQQTKVLPQQQVRAPAAASGMPANQQLTGPLLSMQASGGRSAVTNRTRVLAAGLGVVRPGAAGSSLRLAGTICRSNSGTLVDCLLSEAARADAGLLTAGLPRSDSLPEALLGGPLPAAAAGGGGSSNPQAAAALGVEIGVAAKGPVLSDSVRECLRDIAGLASLNIMDLDLPSMSLSGLPSLTFMLEQRSLLEAARSFEPPAAQPPPAAAGAPTAQHQQQPSYMTPLNAPEGQQQQQADVSDLDQFMMHPTPFLKSASFAAKGEDSALLPAVGGAGHTSQSPSAAAAVAAHWVSKALGQAPNFTSQGRVAAALLAHELPPPPPTTTIAARGGGGGEEPSRLNATAAAVVGLPDQLHTADAAAAVADTQPLSVPPLLNRHNMYLPSPHHQHQQQQQPHLPPQQQQLMQSFGGLLAPSSSCQIRQLQVELGMFGSALAAAPGGHHVVQPQDTLDGLLQQVNQELMAEAYTKQRAALQFGTVHVPAPAQHAASTSAAAGAAGCASGGAALPVSPFTGISDSGVVAGVPGSLMWQQPGMEVFDLGQNWHMGPGSTAASAGTAAAYGSTAAVAAFDPAVSRGLLLHGGVSPGAAAAATAAHESRLGQKQEVVRYSRVITCKTYLKRLNITQPMAEHLLPYHNVHAQPARTTSAAAADDDSPRAEGNKPGGSSYELMFKEDVYIVDCHGARYKVVYEGVSCNQQKHLRLTSGWRDYIRGHAVQVGDTVVFERRGDDRHTLYVTVVKGDVGLTAAGQDGDEAAGGPAKKRRVSRSQAVQRLE